MNSKSQSTVAASDQIRRLKEEMEEAPTDEDTIGGVLIAAATIVFLIFMFGSGPVHGDQILVDKSRQYLYVIDDHDVIVFKSKVIIGRDSRPTPNFSDTVTHIVTNPYWNIPSNLLYRDVLPTIRRVKGYMEAQGLEVLDREGQDVTSLFKSNGMNMEPGWRMRQAPGPNNALGQAKFMFEDRMAHGPPIFMHDTNHPELFEQPNRRFSSGCIRVERWSELAQLLGVRFEPSRHERWRKIDPIRITIVGD